MEKWQIKNIALRLDYLKEYHDEWRNNLMTDSTDPVYSVICTSKMCEAEAEHKGILFVLNNLGYKAEYVTDHHEISFLTDYKK